MKLAGIPARRTLGILAAASAAAVVLVVLLAVAVTRTSTPAGSSASTGPSCPWLNQSLPVRQRVQVQYSEGINVAYRYYDANNETPLFPFGYGLSYTSFRYRGLRNDHDLSYWDDTANGWVVPSGRFVVYVGDSSAMANLPLRGNFNVTRSLGVR